MQSIIDIYLPGEKADIAIKGWKNKTVKIEAQLISRNPKKEKAEQDLRFIKYNLDKSGKIINLSNSFISNKNAQISSNLSVKFNVWTPDNSLVQIENLYGDVHLLNFLFHHEFEVQFFLILAILIFLPPLNYKNQVIYS